MYTKKILEGYADAIPDEKERALFKEKMAQIDFQKVNNQITCTAGTIERLLKGTEIEHLIDDLGQRFIQFMTEDDFPQS